MKIKIFSTEIYISFLFTAVIAFLLLTDRTGLILPSIFAVLIHETGHLFAMWIMDCSPKSIRLIPASVQIVRSFSPKPHGESIIAVFGPLFNLVLCFTLLLNYYFTKTDYNLYFAAINLVFGCFNLLPVKGLDGGILLYNAMCKVTDAYKAERTVQILTLTLSFIALSIGIYLAVYQKFNISVFTVAIYLFAMSMLKK